MLQEEFGFTEFVSSPDCNNISDKVQRDGPQDDDARPLSDELIERCCGSHSLGLVYWFLRKAGMDDAQARAEFEQFLSGTLSPTVLDIAAKWIRAERAGDLSETHQLA